MNNLLSGVMAAVTDAGVAIEAIRASGQVGLEVKGDGSPITRADSAANDILQRHLLALEPAAWLSEESADSSDRLSCDSVWVVDPLDGTKEFVEGVPQFAIAVALVRDGRPILGVVHNPATGDVFSALRGGGAQRNGRPIRIAEGNVLLSSRSEMRRGEFDGFSGWTLDPVGSIALKLAMVAAGMGAVTLSRGPKWEWDVCAGSLIVEEAGGVSFDMFGDALRFNSTYPKVRGVLAGAPDAAARIQRLLDRLGPSDRMAELSDGPR